MPEVLDLSQPLLIKPNWGTGICFTEAKILDWTLVGRWRRTGRLQEIAGKPMEDLVVALKDKLDPADLKYSARP